MLVDAFCLLSVVCCLLSFVYCLLSPLSSFLSSLFSLLSSLFSLVFVFFVYFLSLLACRRIYPLLFFCTYQVQLFLHLFSLSSTAPTFYFFLPFAVRLDARAFSVLLTALTRSLGAEAALDMTEKLLARMVNFGLPPELQVRLGLGLRLGLG